MKTFIKPTSGLSRVRDYYGSGQFHASRGRRLHNGLDLVSRPNEFVKSPIKGVLTREANPYRDDPRFKGVLIKGTGEFDGIEVKLFYVMGLKCGNVEQGEVIGTAQDLSIKYPGITNHIHMEVKEFGLVTSPNKFFNYCI